MTTNLIWWSVLCVFLLLAIVWYDVVVSIMTNTVAHLVQSCFTTTMPATKTRRESKYEKAERLVAEDRYAMDPQSSPPEFWVGTCRGDHGNYAVFAISEEYMERHRIAGGRVGCNCRYGRQGGLCAHAIGGEELRTRGEQ